MLTFTADIPKKEPWATKIFIFSVNLFTASFRYFWKIFSKIIFSLQETLTFLYVLLVFLNKHLIRVEGRRDLMWPALSTEISCHAHMVSAIAYYCTRQKIFSIGDDVMWGSPPNQLKICSYPSPVDLPPPNFYSHPPKVNFTSTKK